MMLFVWGSNFESLFIKKSNFEAIDLLQTADLNETKGKSSKF